MSERDIMQALANMIRAVEDPSAFWNDHDAEEQIDRAQRLLARLRAETPSPEPEAIKVVEKHIRQVERSPGAVCQKYGIAVLQDVLNELRAPKRFWEVTTPETPSPELGEVERCNSCNASQHDPCAYPTENARRLMATVERLREALEEISSLTSTSSMSLEDALVEIDNIARRALSTKGGTE